MGFRFYKRIKIFPGVSLNLSNKSASISIGTKGLKYTIGPKRQHFTIGIPGTGLYYTEKLNNKPKKESSKKIKTTSSRKSIPQEDVIIDFQRNTNSFFLQGVHAYNQNNLGTALEYFQRDGSYDAKFFIGLILIRQKKIHEAILVLEDIYKNAFTQLGNYVEQLQINPIIHFSISKEIIVSTTLNKITLLLLLTELYQAMNNTEKALEYIRIAIEIESENKLILLSLVELMYDFCIKIGQLSPINKIIENTNNIKLEDFISAGILYYRAMAFLMLDQKEKAKELFNLLLENPDILSTDLKLAIQQEKNKLLLNENKINFKDL